MAKAEDTSRRFSVRQAAGVSLIAIVASAAWDFSGLRPAGAQAPAQSLTVSELVLVDAAGKPVARLGTGPDGVGLAVLDAAGLPRVAILVRPDSAAGIVMMDSAGKPAMRLGVEANGARGVALLDADGGDRAVLFSDPSEDHAGLVLSSSEVSSQVELACMGTGDAGLAINNADGVSTIAAGTGPPGTGIALRDNQGNELFNLGFNDKSGASMALKNPNGQPLWHAP